MKFLWSIIMVFALSFTAIYVPIRIAFIEEVSLNLFIIESVVDCIFLCDIFNNFMTAFYDQNHKLITDPKKIIKKYLKGWFVIDLVAL